MTHANPRPLIVFLNGPFGGGKTSVADQLATRIPHSRIFDPEEVGFMLRDLLSGYACDFQDLPPWRALVAATAAEIAAFTGQTLIAPMSILNPDYATEIFTALDKHAMTVCHLLLHTDTPTLHTRIDGHDLFPDDPERSAEAAAFRRSKITTYQQAHPWLTAHAHQVIDTTTHTPAEAADLAAQHLTHAHHAGDR